MFNQLSNASRLNEGMGGGGYTSTHPLSIQLMSDIQNRVAEVPVVHHKDSDAFWYVRAKLRVLQAQDNQAHLNAKAKLRLDAQQTDGVEQSAAWYGLAYADWQSKDLSAAQEALAKAQQGGRSSPEIAALSVALALEKGDQALALSLAQSAWSRWPNSQGIAQIGRAHV